MRPVFADPKTDLIFKRIFGQPAHKHVLIALLNDLLELPDDRRIVDLEYLTPEQVPVIAELKRSIVDVKCRDRAGTHYVVEMQVLNVEGFEKRFVYNAAKAYVGQLGKGENYPQLNDVVAIAICDFELWPSRSAPRGTAVVPMLSRFQMREVHSGAAAFEQLRLVVLELPKYAAGATPRTTVERWAYFFSECDDFREVPPVLAAPPYSDALDLARVSALSEAELDAYERELMAETDARQALVKAVNTGRSEGHAVGHAEGHATGLQDALIALLTAKASPTSGQVERIRACRDPSALMGWLTDLAAGRSPRDLVWGEDLVPH